MNDSANQYDVLISHNAADREWVDSWLLPRLEAAGLRVAVDYRDFLPGPFKLENIEQAVKASRHIVAVLSPQWVENDWNALEAQLVAFEDPAARQRKLLPVLWRDCELPERIGKLEAVDMRKAGDRERQVRRLIQAVQGVTPPPARRQVEQWQWLQWWMRYHGRQVRRGLTALSVVVMVAWAILGLPPLHSRPGWQALASPEASGLSHLWAINDALFITTHTDTRNINTPDSGLWRSSDGGGTWQASRIPLEFERNGRQRAEVHDLAFSPARPGRVYAATSDVGLLRSDDGGASWIDVTSAPLPSSLLRVGVSPLDADFVVAVALRSGVFRSGDGGGAWERLDGTNRCTDAGKGGPLPVNMDAEGLLVTATAIYVGSTSLDDVAAPDAGLYASADGGDCWRMVHDGRQIYGYKALAPIPADLQSLLILAYDFSAGPDEDPNLLWKLSTEGGQPQTLWTSADAVAGRIAISAEPRPTWFVATDRGAVFHGPVDQASSKQSSRPRILRCLISCESDLALADDGQTLLFLAGDQLYRSGDVSIFRLIWP